MRPRRWLHQATVTAHRGEPRCAPYPPGGHAGRLQRPSRPPRVQFLERRRLQSRRYLTLLLLNLNQILRATARDQRYFQISGTHSKNFNQKYISTYQ